VREERGKGMEGGEGRVRERRSGRGKRGGRDRTKFREKLTPLAYNQRRQLDE